MRREEDAGRDRTRPLLVLGRLGGELAQAVRLLEPEGLYLALCLESTSVRPLDLLGQFSLEQFFNAFAARFLAKNGNEANVGKGSFLVVRDLGRVDLSLAELASSLPLGLVFLAVRSGVLDVARDEGVGLVHLALRRLEECAPGFRSCRVGGLLLLGESPAVPAHDRRSVTDGSGILVSRVGLVG